MYPPDIFRHTVSRLVAILQRYGVRFHLTGGITSVAYGEPRMTQRSQHRVSEGQDGRSERPAMGHGQPRPTRRRSEAQAASTPGLSPK